MRNSSSNLLSHLLTHVATQFTHKCCSLLNQALPHLLNLNAQPHSLYSHLLTSRLNVLQVTHFKHSYSHYFISASAPAETRSLLESLLRSLPRSLTQRLNRSCRRSSHMQSVPPTNLHARSPVCLMQFTSKLILPVSCSPHVQTPCAWHAVCRSLGT